MNNQQAAAPARSEAQKYADDPLNDTFFAPVANTKPFFKCAMEGLAGSGKTYTASDIAIGLHKRIGSTKPIVMFDTEKAAKFLKTKFADAGIQLMVRESKTLQDLITTMKKCEDGFSDILIIDSISHVWENTVEAYKKKYNRAALQFQDWGTLKPLWKAQFSDTLVNSKLHIFMNGRAGFEYENEINEQTGKREIYKSGVKMKVEGETAYEPDMLVLMERFEEILGKDKKIYRQATIIKDRSQLIDGKVFINPSYKDFEVVIEDMLVNPESKFQDPETDSTGLFNTDEDRYRYITDKKICLEEIEGELLRAWPSTSVADKTKKLEVIETVFATRSWLAVENLSLKPLQEGLVKIKEIVKADLAAKFPEQAEGAEAPAKPDPATAVVGKEKEKEGKGAKLMRETLNKKQTETAPAVASAEQK